MKTEKKIITLSPFSPIAKSFIARIVNKEEVKVSLEIKLDEPYKIYVTFDEESIFQDDQNVSFTSKNLYYNFLCYLKSLEIKGAVPVWSASITDFCNTGLGECEFELTIPLIWEYDDDEIKQANTEALRIIQDAKRKAFNERKRIFEYLKNELKDMHLNILKEIQHDREEGSRMSVRLNQYLSMIAQKSGMSKEDSLHEMLKYMTLYIDEDIITRESEKDYRWDIQQIKRKIKFLQERCGQLESTVKKHDYSKRIPESVWSLTRLYDDLSSLYAELYPKIGAKTSLIKTVESKVKINNILKEFGYMISPDYSSLWEKLMETLKELEQFKRLKKEEEKEERERCREEEKARKEWEREKIKAEKDEALAQKKLEEARKKLLQDRKNEEEYKKLKNQIAALEEAYKKAIQRKERAISMAEQTKKGFVYIISNVNSFGENVFKIGLTRRVNPTERVDELGNASVPFPFNINALIESDNAPALEAALHRRFEDKKINKKNWRKEFFNITFDDIEKALQEKGIKAPIIKKYFV